MIKLIVFDFDGVIIDSFISLFNVYKIIAREQDVKLPDDPELFRQMYIENYNYKGLYMALGISDYENAEEIFKREIVRQDSQIFPEIDKVIKTLSKKYKLILLSNTTHEEVMLKINKFKLEQYFSFIKGRAYEEKQKADYIKECMDKFNFSLDEIVYIGDRNIDYDLAMKLGINNIVMANYGWGYDENKISKDTIRVDKPKDILKAVKLIETKML